MMWLDIQIFGFRALWSPYFILFILALALAYYLMTGPYRHKFGGGEKVTNKQQTYFYTSLVLLYLVKGSPVDLLSHIMLSAHMAQLAILRSEEHTSELQSRGHLVCRVLLEQKKYLG